MLVKSPSQGTVTFDPIKDASTSEMALIEIISKYHEKMGQINQYHMQGMRDTSQELDLASKHFLEELRALFETEKKATVMKPYLKSLEYIASFMTIALGVGLCATGAAAVVGSVMVATGVFGCVHTTLELTDSYTRLANLTQDKYTQEIIKTYLPAMVSTCLALSATIAGTYCAAHAIHATRRTLELFWPLVIQSIQSSQVITKGVFDLQRNRAEAKKLDHEALGKCLEAILQEQQEIMMHNTQHQSKLNRETHNILKILTSLYKHI
jgi:hypothetical protein